MRPCCCYLVLVGLHPYFGIPVESHAAPRLVGCIFAPFSGGLQQVADFLHKLAFIKCICAPDRAIQAKSSPTQ